MRLYWNIFFPCINVRFIYIELDYVMNLMISSIAGKLADIFERFENIELEQYLIQVEALWWYNRIKKIPLDILKEVNMKLIIYPEKIIEDPSK